MTGEALAIAEREQEQRQEPIHSEAPPQGQIHLASVVRRAREATATRSIGSWLRDVVKAASVRSGLAPAVQRLWSGEAVVLMYHKVQRRPAGLWGEQVLHVDAFDEQLAYLARHCDPIGLWELAEGLRGRRPLPPRPVVITFDDGYRNNLLLAAPLLAKHRVPATLFVTTGLVGTQRWMWAYELDEMFLRYPAERIAQASGSRELAWLCSLELPRVAMSTACIEFLKQISFDAQNDIMRRLRRALPVEVDDENRFLSWDEVREIRSYGVEIGAHTVNHPLLVRVPIEEAEREIAGSREMLHEQLGNPPRLFAYPNGDTNQALTRIVGRYFEAAVTATQGTCGSDVNLLEIPRLGAPETVDALAFGLTRRFMRTGRLALESRAGLAPLSRELNSDWAQYL